MTSLVKTRLVAAVFVFAPVFFLFVEPAAAISGHTKIRVLVVDGFSNHDWRQTTALLARHSGTIRFVHGFGFEAPPSAASPGWEQWEPKFSDYDVVIQTCNDIGGGPSWRREVQIAFEQFIRDGGGALVFHSGNNAFADWAAYNRMIGLGWRKEDQGDALTIDQHEKIVRILAGQGENTGHDSRSDVVVHRLGDDPIHHGMPRAWKTHDAGNLLLCPRAAKNLRVLSYGYDKHTGMNWALEWTVRFGRGRIYSSTFGHVWKGDVQPLSLRCAGEQTVLLRTLQWLAKHQVTIPVPPDFPSEAAISIPARDQNSGARLKVQTLLGIRTIPS